MKQLLILSGELVSRSTRYFNAALHSGQLDTVKGYLGVSALFNFKSINLELNSLRFIGARKESSVKRRKLKSGNGDLEERRSVFINGRNLIIDEPDFIPALRGGSKELLKGSFLDT